MAKDQNFRFLNFFEKIWIIVLSIIIILIRIIPYLKNKIISTGFDTGYYRRYLAFKNAPYYILDKSLIIQKIFDLFRIIKIPADVSLLIIPSLFAILTAYGIYLIGSFSHSKKAGIACAFLFAASPAQFLAFDYMLIKNIAGLFLFVFAIFIFIRDSSRYQTLNLMLGSGILILAVLTHRTTSFVAIATLLIYFFCVFAKNRYKINSYQARFLLAMAFISFLATWMNFTAIKMLFNEISSGFSADLFAVREGMFINIPQYFIFSFPILPFAAIGFVEKIKKREFDIIFAFAIFCVLWILLQLIFYKRIIIFLDLALILLSIPAFGDIFSRAKTASILLLIAPIVAAAVISFRISFADLPSISKRDFENIQNLANLPQGTVLAISSAEAPWIYGWTSHSIIAPGLFENQWPYKDWDEFWNQENPEWFQRKKELMALNIKDNKPLYIFTGAYVNLPALPEECLEKINEMAWEWVCR